MGKTYRLLLLTILLAIFIIFSFGCSANVQVEDIVANPSQYVGKSVTIADGSTKDAFWLQDLNKGAYKLQGKTGVEVWVVTTNTPPQLYEVVSIRGVVSENYMLGDVSLGTVILERSRRLIYHYPLPGDKTSTTVK